MKNLFIMHTQYNLILSAAVMSRFENAENTLVLYSEFTLNDEMRYSLERLFDRVIVVRDRFASNMKPLEEIIYIRKCMKKVKSIKNERFDNVYMSQERIFDMILCARAKKNNLNVRCYNIEEDAYYSINEKYNAEDYVHIENKRTRRRKTLLALLLAGHPYNYKDVHYCYGMSSEYHGVNLLFPNIARTELRGKELVEITSEELLFGIDTIYSSIRIDYPKSEKYTLFFFDLMNRYKNPERVKEIMKQIVKISCKEGRTVLFKYHPRETDKFKDVEGAYELPHIIPAEKVLYDLKGTDTFVIGNATTSCIVASKLGYNVISISKIEFPTNVKIHSVMEQMGMFCINNTQNLENIIGRNFLK